MLNIKSSLLEFITLDFILLDFLSTLILKLLNN